MKQSFSMLGICAKRLDQIEELRKSENNRLRQIQEGEAGPVVLMVRDANTIAGLSEEMEYLESLAVKALEAEMKKHPLWEWCQETKGIGAKTLGRFFGRSWRRCLH